MLCMDSSVVHIDSTMLLNQESEHFFSLQYEKDKNSTIMQLDGNSYPSASGLQQDAITKTLLYQSLTDAVQNMWVDDGKHLLVLVISETNSI